MVDSLLQGLGYPVTHDDLVHQGKILYWALSTYPAWQLTEAVLLARQYGCYEPVCHQIGYNLMARQVERVLQRFGDRSALPYRRQIEN